MTSIFDWHVNLLPDWARVPAPALDLTTETASMRKAFSHKDASNLNAACSVDHILREMDRSQISRALVFSYQWQSFDRCESANYVVANAVQKYPNRFLGLAVCQPRDARAAKAVERWLQIPGMIGVKMKPKWGGFSLADAKIVGPICELLSARSAILLTHTSQNFHSSEGDSVSDLVRLLRNFPKLTVVAAHLGGFIDVYRLYQPIRSLMKNLYFDISLPSNLAWLPYLMRLGDPEKYLFATDFPYIGFDEMLSRINSELGLSEREIRMLCYENSGRLLSSVNGAL
jgi:uncharacterized protein